LSERQGERGPDPVDHGHSDRTGRPAQPPDRRPPGSAGRREKRIRRLKELVQDADYDVPSDEVAARIIRDALFGAPGPDEPS
jgi:hypothetical protein